MEIDTNPQISTLEELEEGDAVLFNDRCAPVVVRRIKKWVLDAYTRVTVVHRAYCDGPRGGEIILEELKSGRIRFLHHVGAEGRTVDDLRLGCPSNAALA